MNEHVPHEMMTTTTQPSAKGQRPNIVLLFTVVVPIICAILGFLTPSPFKEWGLAGLLISLGSLMLYRAAEQFLGDTRAVATLPYSIATFLVLVPVAIWGTGDYQRIALIVFLTLVGVATFYSIVRIAVDEFKKQFLHR